VPPTNAPAVADSAEVHRVDPESGPALRLFNIGIFAPTAGSTCEFWMSPVNLTLHGGGQAVYVFTAELYPPEARATAVGCCSACARLGGMAGLDEGSSVISPHPSRSYGEYL
jgi:hypothetical protein